MFTPSQIYIYIYTAKFDSILRNKHSQIEDTFVSTKQTLDKTKQTKAKQNNQAKQNRFYYLKQANKQTSKQTSKPANQQTEKCKM